MAPASPGLCPEPFRKCTWRSELDAETFAVLENAGKTDAAEPPLGFFFFFKLTFSRKSSKCQIKIDREEPRGRAEQNRAAIAAFFFLFFPNRWPSVFPLYSAALRKKKKEKKRKQQRLN